MQPTGPGPTAIRALVERSSARRARPESRKSGRGGCPYIGRMVTHPSDREVSSMWRKRAVGLVAAAILLTGGTAIAASNKNFGTHLKGEHEVPTRETRAQGQATFQLSDDGNELHYKLNVANIENVFMAHIHQGPSTGTGPVVVWLYPSTVPGVQAPLGGGRINGRIAEGRITAANLTGPLTGHPLSDLVAAIQAGNAYVNVHTSDGVAPIDTGPGDFPGGEIRGQLP
jgi:hypothetical protein